MTASLLAQAAADPTGVLLQYGGPVGAVAVIALGAVGVLFRLLLTAYQRERDRADRLEEEVRSLQKDAREQVVPALTRSTEAVADAMQVMSTMKFRR